MDKEADDTVHELLVDRERGFNSGKRARKSSLSVRVRYALRVQYSSRDDSSISSQTC